MGMIRARAKILKPSLNRGPENFRKVAARARKNPQQPLKETWRPGLKYLLALLGIMALLIPLSCDFGDYWEQYAGINLISGLGFDAEGRWVLSEQSGTYLAYARVDAAEGITPPAEAPAGSGVYRLEIKNLKPDGDFEETPLGTTPAGWSMISGPDPVIIDTGPYRINGRTLEIVLTTDRTARFSLSGIPFVEGGNYRFLYSYRSSAATPIDLILNGTSWSFNTQNPVAFPEDYQLSVFPYTSETQQLEYGNYNYNGSLYIDNFRVVRTDLLQGLYFSLEPDDPQLVQPLLDGRYKFSVYARLEGPAGSPLGDNSFAASSVSLGMYLVDAETRPPYEGGARKAFTADVLSEEWTLLEIYSETWSSIFNLSDPAGTDIKILILAVTPTNTLDENSFDAGRVLLSYPVLEYIRD